jgi:hypothetical protein
MHGNKQQIQTVGQDHQVARPTLLRSLKTTHCSIRGQNIIDISTVGSRDYQKKISLNKLFQKTYCLVNPDCTFLKKKKNSGSNKHTRHHVT